jgi:general L-amino acid transport system permease protein
MATAPLVQPWRRWVRAHPLQAALSLLGLVLGVYLLLPAIDWAILKADFRGADRSACDSGGACWVFVKVRIEQFMLGFYPSELAWRPLLTLGLWLLGMVPLFWHHMPGRWIVVPLQFLLLPFLSWAVLDGSWLGWERIESARWGGLLLTLLIASIGISLSLPLGILLALGRRSRLPVIKWLAVSFIEVWRGVPLIAVLFMASVMLPLFLPPRVEIDKLLRCLVGVTLFTSAYMAEVIRGGLQAIPKGQYEAAAALNLSFFQTMGLVILPQALRKVIPGIVNTFIGLFKDTSLVLIVGMFDLLGMVQAASTDPEWLGMAMEGYVFAGFVFWLFSFAMSRYSLRLEQRLQH